MNNQAHADARQRIDAVVTRYRENDGADKFEYQVKDTLVFSNVTRSILSILGALFLAIALTTSNEIKAFYCLSMLLVVLLLLAFPLIAHFFKVFQEKVWEDDFVSDDDVLYLCENESLKLVLVEEIKEGKELTYSDLHKNIDDYIDRSEWLRKQELKKALLSKIEQI